MSREYDLYLQEHKNNVMRAYMLIGEFCPELVLDGKYSDIIWQICFDHDASKITDAEYNAYDEYFYGGNRSYEVKNAFDYAWLNHIHNNPHHWQHWLLFEDDPSTDLPYKVLEMPYNYILEMVCDWWSFSIKTRKLDEVFNWYEKHKDTIKLASKTQEVVDDMLAVLKEAIEEKDNIMLEKLDVWENEAELSDGEDDDILK